MGATSIANPRRVRDGYFDNYLKGKGVDMGCGLDPVTPDCIRYDSIDGKDCQDPHDLEPASFDWVFSSHCLEHVPRPKQTIDAWWELVRPGGHMVISVPDWTLYEQRTWPSRFNSDHKWQFEMFRRQNEGHIPERIVFSDLFTGIPDCQILSYRLCDTGYNYTLAKGLYDRTWHDKAEAEIEIVCRKQQLLWV